MSAPQRPIVEADIHAFVDGQMDFERRAVIVQAMTTDPDLRAKVEQWRRQNEALTATFGGVLREPLPLRLMPTTLARETDRRKSVAEAPIASAPATQTAPISASSARIAAIVMAAFVAGGATVFIVEAVANGSAFMGAARPIDSARISGGRDLALRAYEAHRTFATDLTHPVEVPASDQEALLKWLQHRLSMAIHIPDLRRDGWTLIGGRVLPGEFGPAAFLIYENGVERLGVYMARSNLHREKDLSVYDNGAGLGSVGYWVDEPIGYAITTNRDSAWLDRNGLALYQSIKAQARALSPE